MNLVDDLAVCIISYSVNFLAEATLQFLHSPVDIYVIHIEKDHVLTRSFATLPNIKHIEFNTSMTDHGTMLNQICFHNPEFTKIFEKYKWIMFFDHDVIIIENHDVFWSTIEEKLYQDPDYCIYSIYPYYSTCLFFIIEVQRLKEVVKNKRYEFIYDVGFTTLNSDRDQEKKEYFLTRKQVAKSANQWFDTGRTLVKLCGHVYNIPNFQFYCESTAFTSNMFHLSSSWTNNTYARAYIRGDKSIHASLFEICTDNIVKNIKSQTYHFHSQYDIDKLLSYEGMDLYFQRSPNKFQVEKLSPELSFIRSLIMVNYQSYW